jgi:hypothetical protein
LKPGSAGVACLVQISHDLNSGTASAKKQAVLGGFQILTNGLPVGPHILAESHAAQFFLEVVIVRVGVQQIREPLDLI